MGGLVTVGAASVGGKPTKRARRKCSTMPERRELRCSLGQTALISGTTTG